METTSVTTQLWNISVDENGEPLPSEGFDPHATYQLRPKLVSANQFIIKLQNELSTLRLSQGSLKRDLTDYLTEYAEEIDEEHLKGIAEIFDIELSKTIEFVAQVEVKGTIEVPLWQTSDYFDEVTITANLDWGVDGEVTDVTITEIEEA